MRLPFRTFIRACRSRLLALLVLAICCSGLLLLAQSAPVIGLPAGMAYDASGNLFIADASRHRIVEVTVGGSLMVVAGTGEQGFGGDGGPATAALLNEPEGVAIASDGSLMIADTGNRRVRAITHGVITTVAGTGMRGDAGDSGPAVSATFGRPSALATRADGGLLVCDTGNHRVRLIHNGTIQAFAGNGTQGFGGDGAAAALAELDSPQGIATLPDGRVVIADSHNNRLRIVGTDGVIRTIAGTGVAGYSGDGGPAVTAMLSLPRGVSVTSDGTIVFADSDNQRIRALDANGTISTLGGGGTQGTSGDAANASSTSLNVPRGVAVSPYGAAALGDLSGPALKAVAADGKVYLVPAPVTRVSTVNVAVSPSTIYGQTSATVTVTAAVPPQGQVEVEEAGTSMSSGALSGGALALHLPTLSAGSHTLIARYAGDGVNPAAASGQATVTVQPASVVAKADAAAVAYGERIPALSGSLAGVLPQDASGVGVAFTTTAALLSDSGTYPIAALLSGPASANYALSNSASTGSFTIHPAHSKTTLQAPAQASYEGMPLIMNATVLPQFAGVPTGAVEFLENGAVIGKDSVASGTATATYLAPSAGSHVITAAYSGNGNFLSSGSAPMSIAVTPLPDFSLSSNATSQSVQSGLVASFVFDVVSKGGPFTGSVVFSVSGLPAGATASFSPAVVVPGSSGASSTLAIQTPALRAGVAPRPFNREWPFLAIAPMLFVLRRRKWQIALVGCSFALLLTVTGCGARTVGGAPVTIQTFPLVITGTSTNLAGNLVTHTLPITLITR